MSFTAWGGTIAFGPWWLLRSGPLEPAETHAHHAIQVVVHGGAPCISDSAGEPVPGPIAVIAADQAHTIHAHRDHALVLYVEPSSAVGQLLREGVADVRPPIGRGHPVGEILGSLQPTNWSRVDEAVQRTIAQVGVNPIGESIFWWRHPTFDAALIELAESADRVGDIGLPDVADRIGVSAERLAQLFPGEVGLPLLDYARWLRLVRAAEQLIEGDPMDVAARSAGFIDSVQLDRSMTEMFGMPAGQLTSSGVWIR